MRFDRDNLHPATRKRLDKLEKQGFSIGRYKRIDVEDFHRVEIYFTSVADLYKWCLNHNIDPEKTEFEADYEGYEVYINYKRPQTDQEFAVSSMKKYEEHLEMKECKARKEAEEREKLRKLAEKYPDEIE